MKVIWTKVGIASRIANYKRKKQSYLGDNFYLEIV